ncbi:MAG: hypothetical protein ABL921_06925 [Pirellula sp.]
MRLSNVREKVSEIELLRAKKIGAQEKGLREILLSRPNQIVDRPDVLLGEDAAQKATNNLP